MADAIDGLTASRRIGAPAARCRFGEAFRVWVRVAML